MVKIKLKADFRDHPYLSVKLTKARRIKKRLPRPLPWIDGSLNGSYLEIAEALVFGLNHAVMTLSGGLCEHLFRLCLYEKHGGGERTDGINHGIDMDFWRHLNGKTLCQLLGDCKKQRILPKEDHKWWFDDFSEKARNSYVHFKVFDILAGEREIAVDALTGEEYDRHIQPHKDEWAVHKKGRDEQMALSFFSELTGKALRIFDVMDWKERKPETGADAYVCKQYKKFFSDDFGSYDPGFINIPDDYWVDY